MADYTEKQLFELAQKFLEKSEANAKANPTSDHIQVVVVEPMKKPYKKTIPNNLDSMKEIVGGWIENVFIGETETGAKLGIVVNEEGLLIGLPFNRKIAGWHTLVGTLFITAYNLEGDNVSLTDEVAEKLIKQFDCLEVHL